MESMTTRPVWTCGKSCNSLLHTYTEEVVKKRPLLVQWQLFVKPATYVNLSERSTNNSNILWTRKERDEHLPLLDEAYTIAEKGVYVQPLLFSITDELKKLLPSGESIKAAKSSAASMKAGADRLLIDEKDVQQIPLMDPRCIEEALEVDQMNLPPGYSFISTERSYLSLQKGRFGCKFCRFCPPVDKREYRTNHFERCIGLHRCRPFYFCHFEGCAYPTYTTYKCFRLHLLAFHCLPSWPIDTVIGWPISTERAVITYDTVIEEVFDSHVLPLMRMLCGSRVDGMERVANLIKKDAATAQHVSEARRQSGQGKKSPLLVSAGEYCPTVRVFLGRPVLRCFVRRAELDEDLVLAMTEQTRPQPVPEDVPSADYTGMLFTAEADLMSRKAEEKRSAVLG